MANVTTIAGHVPNYVNPVTRQPVLLGINISFTLAALICVGLRVYTRKFLRNVAGVEDLIIMAAMLFAVTATICTCLGCKLGGTGLHYWDIPPTVNKRLNQQLSYVNQFLYQIILQLTKISILLFYISLSNAQYLRKWSWGMIGLSATFCLACTIVEIFQCSPVQKSIYGASVAGVCIQQPEFFKATGFINLFMDLVVLVLPLPLLWSLQAPLRQRIALCLIFCVGIFVCVCSIIRLKIWYQVSGDGNRNNPDSSWTRVDITDWSAIEYCTGLICASLPHLKPLFAKIMPGFLSTARETRSHELYGYNKSGLGSKRHRIPIGSTEAADTFYRKHKTHSSTVTEGAGQSDSESTDQIVQDEQGVGVPGDKENWHILKTARVDVKGADYHA
ncbi:uncharacterized protein PAC_04090 [Phialocephala subalpina]|uniref:Rhodopsin domain-containing protein n=1 Tax=Phialocephala subalpina TaxID=576137 RepID=A0A1L7WN58_9HELO|nr:uncharacterized protein PAC_04090 [Phialocephala subalpina]